MLTGSSMQPLLLLIREIAVIPARELRHITIAHGLGVYLRYWRNFRPLPVSDLAKLNVVSHDENGAKIHSSTLEAFLSCSGFDDCESPLAFLLTTVTGERFLLGGYDGPHPAIATTSIFPDRPSEPSGVRITVELSDTIGLLPVLD